ncbi:hypothetical protein S7335_3095 [Synechococcus sp. PCC 7335]|uniref:hypothetical protein n=1 Tax=Synechococcus sp. (strain ATCC 29403 / PCC 7335) TaxID=91464 RepID=UPI00017EB0F0|nr:hypothetical protein [Synechococcus sp. PCC 7335]EDX85394.1 hypothetical protein S7335_3095 [Synechococcus sp. PCC 7335]
MDSTQQLLQAIVDLPDSPDKKKLVKKFFETQKDPASIALARYYLLKYEEKKKKLEVAQQSCQSDQADVYSPPI